MKLILNEDRKTVIRTLWSTAAEAHDASIDRFPDYPWTPVAHNYLTRVATYLEAGNKVMASQIFNKLSEADRDMTNDYLAEALFGDH